MSRKFDDTTMHQVSVNTAYKRVADKVKPVDDKKKYATVKNPRYGDWQKVVRELDPESYDRVVEVKDSVEPETDQTMEEANKPLRVRAGIKDFVDIKKGVRDEIKEFTKQCFGRRQRDKRRL